MCWFWRQSQRMAIIRSWAFFTVAKALKPVLYKERKKRKKREKTALRKHTHIKKKKGNDVRWSFLTSSSFSLTDGICNSKRKDEKRSRLLLSSFNWSAHSTRRSTHNLSVLLTLLASVHVRVCNCAELCCRLPVTPVHHLACFEGSTEKSTMPHKQRGKTNWVIQQVL